MHAIVTSAIISILCFHCQRGTVLLQDTYKGTVNILFIVPRMKSTLQVDFNLDIHTQL